jgi:4-hydroxybenzoate polyprenyltransferase
MSASPEVHGPLVEPPPSPAPRASLPVLLIRALRPRQWTKNFAALAALLFAKAALKPESLERALGAVLTFCLIAGGVYVLNDWIDRDKDKLHPEKRRRPIASGQLGLAPAAVLLVTVWGLGLGLAYAIRWEFLQLALGYIVMQIFYSLWLKRVVILDVVIIATGFILRVAGGGVAIDVPISNWLYLCTLLLAVFLGFAKRRHELASLQADAVLHRENLSEYSVPMLDQMMSVVAASCIVAYGLYTVAPETVRKVGGDGLKFTVPFVIYGIFRYLFLIHRRNAGGSPERILLSDVPMMIDLGLYIAVAGWVLYR